VKKMSRLVRWRAIYSDGTYFDQFKNPYDEDEEDQNKYTDIDRNKLKGFMIYQGIKKIRILMYLHLSEGCRLFMRRRTEKVVNGKVKSVVYIVGWEKTLTSGDNQKIICVISDDGEEIIVFDEWKPELGIEEVELLECEK